MEKNRANIKRNTLAKEIIRVDFFTSTTNINDYSLSILIEFNNVVFIYGGDIENKTINYLIQEGLQIDNVGFLKAPHHGSNSTNSIFKLVNILRRYYLCNY